MPAAVLRGWRRASFPPGDPRARLRCSARSSLASSFTGQVAGQQPATATTWCGLSLPCGAV
eukprot:12720354-Alexandrium_andersonii.AAC.1